MTHMHRKIALQSFVLPNQSLKFESLPKANSEAIGIDSHFGRFLDDQCLIDLIDWYRTHFPQNATASQIQINPGSKEDYPFHLPGSRFHEPINLLQTRLTIVRYILHWKAVPVYLLIEEGFSAWRRYYHMPALPKNLSFSKLPVGISASTDFPKWSPQKTFARHRPLPASSH